MVCYVCEPVRPLLVARACVARRIDCQGWLVCDLPCVQFVQMWVSGVLCAVCACAVIWGACSEAVTPVPVGAQPGENNEGARAGGQHHTEKCTVRAALDMAP